MSSSNLPNLDYVYFRSPFFWLCLTPNSSYFKFLICQLTKFIMPISKGLIPNTILCLIPKVLLQCHVLDTLCLIPKVFLHRSLYMLFRAQKKVNAKKSMIQVSQRPKQFSEFSQNAKFLESVDRFEVSGPRYGQSSDPYLCHF